MSIFLPKDMHEKSYIVLKATKSRFWLLSENMTYLLPLQSEQYCSQPQGGMTHHVFVRNIACLLSVSQQEGGWLRDHRVHGSLLFVCHVLPLQPGVKSPNFLGGKLPSDSPINQMEERRVKAALASSGTIRTSQTLSRFHLRLVRMWRWWSITAGVKWASAVETGCADAKCNHWNCILRGQKWGHPNSTWLSRQVPRWSVTRGTQENYQLRKPSPNWHSLSESRCGAEIEIFKYTRCSRSKMALYYVSIFHP